MLIDFSIQKGLQHIVISSGSRNAPLTISFASLPQFKCYSIVDERSAGFFALGLARQINSPVALVCTSGSALLNYAPAVSEAYYQQIPLLVLSADRPAEWIDQADGQTIRQHGALANFVKYECQLPAQLCSEDDSWHTNRMLNESFFHLTQGAGGPVHINIPLKEPLYGKAEYRPGNVRVIDVMDFARQIEPDTIIELEREWKNHSKVLILIGQHVSKNQPLLLEQLSWLASLPQVVILNESLSGMDIPGGFNRIDTLVSAMDEQQKSLLQPSLLITFDGAVVSKMVKSFLRDIDGLKHWHISCHHTHLDTYRHLSRTIAIEPSDFFTQTGNSLAVVESRFGDDWRELATTSTKRHNQYVESAPWSDLKAFEVIGRYLPHTHQLHIANSSPVRYAQLFEPFFGIETRCNRGTSGIDGCTSTAVGAAWASPKPVMMITGDLSFLYDSNALWNNYLKPDFRIVLINNQGGGIFRFISGEGAANQMDEYFVASHDLEMRQMAEMYGFDYVLADGMELLENELLSFFEPSAKPRILEVKTPSNLNGEVLKGYFKYLKANLYP